MKRGFRWGEFIFVVALTLFSLIILFMSLQLGFGKIRSPGAGFFPAFISMFGFVLGILLIVRSFRMMRSQELRKTLTDRKGSLRLMAMIIAFCCWLVLMPWLGFILVTFLATFAFAKIMGLEGWIKPIILAIGGSVFIYLLFDVWFYADLPRGFLG
ncbi:MAG: tripartite tricarboxylate transporter TctB family protein [Deltaproteobacteria bacterium]|nr:tripartite tricarboxylate transporter TctB family protein [Deltaproteobacteria bacterium]